MPYYGVVRSSQSKLEKLQYRVENAFCNKILNTFSDYFTRDFYFWTKIMLQREEMTIKTLMMMMIYKKIKLKSAKFDYVKIGIDKFS